MKGKSDKSDKKNVGINLEMTSDIQKEIDRSKRIHQNGDLIVKGILDNLENGDDSQVEFLSKMLDREWENK